MHSDGSKIWLWQPVSSGRHAFDLPARTAAPGTSAEAVCGAEVNSDELQSVAPDLDWVMQPTCMDCWGVLAARHES